MTRKDAKIRIRTTHLDTLALAWLILSLLSSRNVWHRSGYVAGFWSLVLIPLLLYLAVRLLVHRPEELRLIIAALGLSGGLAALLGLITWIDGGGVSVDGVRRLMGLTFSPNQTALYLLRSLFVWVGLAGWKVDGCLSSRKQIHRRASSNSLNVPGSFASLHLRVEIHHLRIFAWWIVIALVVLALLLTGSRGALFLGIPAGVAALWWLRSPALRWRGPLPAAALTIVVIAGIGLWLAGDRLLNSETVLRRFAIWQGAFHLWQAHPLLGAGPGGFYWTYPAFLLPAASDEPNLLHAHNLWLNIATGWGALGLIWLVSLLLALVQRARQSQKNGRDRLHMGLLAAFAAALAHAQVDAFAVLPELAAWNWIALALLIAANQTLPSSKKTKR